MPRVVERPWVLKSNKHCSAPYVIYMTFRNVGIYSFSICSSYYCAPHWTSSSVSWWPYSSGCPQGTAAHKVPSSPWGGEAYRQPQLVEAGDTKSPPEWRIWDNSERPNQGESFSKAPPAASVSTAALWICFLLCLILPPHFLTSVNPESTPQYHSNPSASHSPNCFRVSFPVQAWRVAFTPNL